MIKEGFIICENEYKEGFLNNLNGIYNYTFLTINELFKKLTFEVSKEGILKASLKFILKPEIIKNYINYLNYIDLFYDHPKLNYLKDIYDYLLKENMIIFDNNYKKYLKTRPITFLGYPKSNNNKYILSILDKEGYEYEFIESKKLDNIKRDVYVFNDIVDESRYVFNSIKKLLDNNISIENIKIVNYSNEYDFIFHRLENYYKIPINFNACKNILSTPISKCLLELVDKYDDYYKVIDELKKKFDNSLYFKRIISIINSYHLYNYDPKLTKDILIMELKNTKFDKTTYEDGIMLINLASPSIKDNDIVFVLGFNQGYVPPIYDDTDYLTDDILSKMNLDTSIDKNLEIENVIINNLNLNINYQISYKLNSPFNTYLKSSLVEDLDYKEIISNNTFGINESEDKIIYSNALDDYFKYGVIDELIKDKIYDVNYSSYDNKFKGINKDILDKYLPKTINLSYSALSNYSKCSFKYLLSNILKLDEFETNLSAHLGTYAHEILDLSYNEDFNYDNAKEKAIEKVLEKNKKELSNKEKFFLDSMDIIINKVIEFNNEHESNITKVKREFKIEIPYDNNKLIFKGFIDKLLIEENNKTYITIIDYKTGSDTISLDNIEDGFNLQLPTYIFMLKKSNEFDDFSIVGFYLNKISPKNYPNFILEGYTNSDEEINIHLDGFTYDKTDYVKSLKRNQDGSYNRYAKIISDEEMDLLAKAVEDYMLKTYENIRLGEFKINPKLIDGKSKSCDYCSFSDVCFKTEKDKVYLEKKNFLEDGE